MAARPCAALTSCIRGCGLRFADRSAEAAFKRDLEQVLVTYTACVGFGLFLFSGVLFWFGATAGDEPVQWDIVGPRTFRLYGILVNVVLFGLSSLLCLLRARCGFLRVLDWELAVIFMIVAVVQQLIVCRPSVYSLICKSVFGNCAVVDMTDGYHLSMEVNGPLNVVMTITAVHLALPIRSCRAWAMDVIVLVEYVLLTFYVARSGHFILSPGDCIQMFTFMGVLAGFAFVGARRNEKQLRSDWKAQGKVVQQTQQLHYPCHGAMTRILSRLCDSLVHLGPDLTIVDPCPSLSALLFRRETHGSNFGDLMALESERPVLVEALRKTSASSSGAEPNVGMMHISLLDSFSNAVRVNVHHACFWAANGDVHYIFGIVESGERQSTPSETAQAQPLPMALPKLSEKQEVVLARGGLGGFTLVSICVELRSLLGDGLEGGPVDALLHSKDLEQFLQWLRKSLDHAEEGKGSTDAAYGTVTLLTRGGDSALMYQAWISGSFHAEGSRAVLRVKPPKYSADSGSRSSGLGTPAGAERRSLKGSQASAASSPRSASSGGSTLSRRAHSISRKFKLTSERGRQNSALNLVCSWNIKVSRKICCGYHANVTEAMRMLTVNLRSHRCEDMHEIMFNAKDACQCRFCGVLCHGPDRGGACTVCGEEDPARDSL